MPTPAAPLACAQDIGLLYRDHHGWLRGWLHRRLGCAHHAADVDPVILPNGEEIVFQSNRTSPPSLLIFDMRTQLLDTAPIANPDDDPNFDPLP